jgi:hypothetical protein
MRGFPIIVFCGDPCAVTHHYTNYPALGTCVRMPGCTTKIGSETLFESGKQRIGSPQKAGIDLRV